MANLIGGKDDTVNSLVVKLVVFLMVVLVVGVGSAVVTTTFTTERELALLQQQVKQTDDQRIKDMQDLTRELSNVANNLGDVSTNLAELSGTLYTKDEAVKEARSVDNRINQLWTNQKLIERSLNAKTNSNLSLDRPQEPDHR